MVEIETNNTGKQDQELPDTNLTKEDRDHLKYLVRLVSARLDEHALFYLSGAFEVAAFEKRKGRV